MTKHHTSSHLSDCLSDVFQHHPTGLPCEDHLADPMEMDQQDLLGLSTKVPTAVSKDRSPTSDLREDHDLVCEASRVLTMFQRVAASSMVDESKQTSST